MVNKLKKHWPDQCFCGGCNYGGAKHVWEDVFGNFDQDNFEEIYRKFFNFSDPFPLYRMFLNTLEVQ